MVKLLKNLLGILLVVLIVGALGAAYVAYLYQTHYNERGPLMADTVYMVEQGASTSSIASSMEQRGIINSSLVFSIAARLRDISRDLRAGEYEVKAGMSIKEILDLLVKGEIKQYKITIPEGLTSHQILKILSNHDTLQGQPPQMIIEGTILPDTYYYIKNEDMNAVLARMQTAMTDTVNSLWEKRANGLPLRSTQDAITLASIVEKETGKPEERRRVAGLFINRLKQNIPLQSDPTVIYALTEGKVEDNGMGPLGRRLLKKDLEFDSPYNTYKYPGLPPGPIGNPGIDSIKAVLNPEEHNFFYMVADGTGGHAFSSTLREHNDNVAKWRNIRKQQGN